LVRGSALDLGRGAHEQVDPPARLAVVGAVREQFLHPPQPRVQGLGGEPVPAHGLDGAQHAVDRVAVAARPQMGAAVAALRERDELVEQGADARLVPG
jgi:hypothetical protein